MNGPQVVCIGCGSPTGLNKPFCDDCAKFFANEVGCVPFCVLCHAGYPLENGMHKTKEGGHAGRCYSVTTVTTTGEKS